MNSREKRRWIRRSLGPSAAPKKGEPEKVSMGDWSNTHASVRMVLGGHTGALENHPIWSGVL